jgi:hypothetical protein
MGHREEERVVLVGTDQRITSGPAAKTAAFKGRIHGCTRTLRSNVRFLLHRGRRPYMAHGRPHPHQPAGPVSGVKPAMPSLCHLPCKVQGRRHGLEHDPEQSDDASADLALRLPHAHGPAGPRVRAARQDHPRDIALRNPGGRVSAPRPSDQSQPLARHVLRLGVGAEPLREHRKPVAADARTLPASCTCRQ